MRANLSKRKIHVLVADDSRVARDLLRCLIESDDELEWVGEATDGMQAVQMTRELKPDIVVMDLVMPGMSGLEATRQIMLECPTPIVIASAVYDARNSAHIFKTLSAGALGLLAKPSASASHDEERRNFVVTLKSLSRFSVCGDRHAHAPEVQPTRPSIDLPPAKPRLLAIGASTGGPKALATLLAALPADFPVPIVVVQHISPEFLEGMVDWLNDLTPLKVTIARQDELCLPGWVYFAPDYHHLRIDENLRASLSDDPPLHNVRPAVTPLFQSAARTLGGAAIGVLLTGMGCDGADGLKEIREAGGLTIAESESTAVVFGMPGAAIQCGAAREVLPLDQIAQFLVSYLEQVVTK